MKSKLKALLGIGLTLVLLTSLTVGLVVPAGAAPAKLKFSTLALPKVDEAGDYWVYPGSDVGAIAVSADGDILFAAVYNGDDPGDLMKSTDGGYSWKMMDDFRTVAEAAEEPDTPIVDVAVSPDYEEDLTVFVATEDFLYQSVDGGKRFVAMTTGWAGETITDLDVALDERGRLAIMVGTAAGVVDVEFTTDEQGTAEWSTEQKTSGSYSAKLWIPAYDPDRLYDEARVVFDYEGDLDSIEGVSYQSYVEGFGGELHPFVSLAVDTDGDTVADSWVVQFIWVGGPNASSHDEWREIQFDDATTIHVAGPNPPSGFSQSDAGTLAELKAETEWGDFAVLEVKVMIGEFVGLTEEMTAYVDDLTVGDVTYDLEPADVYVLSTATGMSWQPQGINTTTNYDVLACAFSPFFADDEGISAVVTDVDKTRVRFSIANTAEGGGWGDDIGDAKVQDALGKDFPSTHARIAFPDDFDAFGIGNNVCFIGIDAGETGVTYDPDEVPNCELGDVYKVTLKSVSSATDLNIRGVITTLQPTATNVTSIDVCGDAEEANIIVGTDYCSLVSTPAYFLVYRSTDGGDSWIPSGTKSPTGGEPVGVPLLTLVFKDAQTQVLMSPDFLTDEIAYAATFDNGDGTSAFSRTKDGGATWNQISLVDYGDVTNGYVIKDLDAAGYNAEGTLHMTTWEPGVTGTNGAVWKRTDGKNWERIWSYANPGVTSDIKELIINGDETMFAVDYDAKFIWRSSDNGATWPKKITTKAALTEVVIVSPTTLYTGHADGSIYWSTKAGTAWTKPDDNEALGTYIPYIVVKGDKVLVGSLGNGKVFVSSDGGKIIERLGISGTGPEGWDTGVALPQNDLGFADNDIIYCTLAPIEEPADVEGVGVWRCEVDWDDPSSSEWEQIDGFQDTVPYNYTNVIASSPAIALPPSGVLYVTDAAAVVTDDGAGGLWRCTNPTDPDPYPYFEKENKGLDAGDSVGLLDLDVFPTVLFCSVSNLDEEEETVAYYNQVVMFTDTLDSGVSLADPADKAAGVGTLYEGQWEVDVVLAWAKMEGATKYQYQIAIDEEFLSVLVSGFTAGQVASLDLSPNTTYYWRVRVAYEDDPDIGNPIGAPLISPWSEKWSFKTVIGPTVARPDLEAPAAGDTDVALGPTFEWSGIEWAEKYEFELGTDPATTAGGYFADALVSLTGANALVSTAWKCDIDLDYESRYYWHVKAFGVDTETPWSDVGTFVTMAKPVLPPEPTAPVEIPPVEEITPGWIWAIIGIGAVLVIAVIVLIVTTRRVP